MRSLLNGIFGTLFILTGGIGSLVMAVWALPTPAKDDYVIHWSVLGTQAFVILLIAGILLVSKNERKN